MEVIEAEAQRMACMQDVMQKCRGTKCMGWVWTEPDTEVHTISGDADRAVKGETGQQKTIDYWRERIADMALQNWKPSLYSTDRDPQTTAWKPWGESGPPDDVWPRIKHLRLERPRGENRIGTCGHNSSTEIYADVCVTNLP